MEDNSQADNKSKSQPNSRRDTAIDSKNAVYVEKLEGNIVITKYKQIYILLMLVPILLIGFIFFSNQKFINLFSPNLPISSLPDSTFSGSIPRKVDDSVIKIKEPTKEQETLPLSTPPKLSPPAFYYLEITYTHEAYPTKPRLLVDGEFQETLQGNPQVVKLKSLGKLRKIELISDSIRIVKKIDETIINQGDTLEFYDQAYF